MILWNLEAFESALASISAKLRRDDDALGYITLAARTGTRQESYLLLESVTFAHAAFLRDQC